MRSVVPWLCLALATASTGCGNSCDTAALETLVRGSESPGDAKRVSAGIRAACSNMPDWMSDNMELAYEGRWSTIDERTERLADTKAVERKKKESGPLRERVCPGWTAEIGRKVTYAKSSRKQRTIWEQCDVARFGLYTEFPTDAGAPAPTHALWDHAVLLYLQDHGVSEGLARKVALALGRPLPDDEAQAR